MDTIAIPIETKVREFDGKLWLGLNLVERGNEVVLGSAGEVRTTVDVTKPDIYITKDPSDNNIEFFDRMRSNGIMVCGLDTEGAVFRTISDYTDNKKDVLDHIDILFAWGKKPADALREQYEHCENIVVTGNPRFDLLNESMREIYNNDYNTDYGDNYVLINTQFSIANPFDHDIQSYKITEEEYNYQSRIMYSFVQSIFYINSKLPKLPIVIRPHPSENHDTYRSIFNRSENIYVRHKGDVRSWIADASVVVHHSCTTGIESALMDTPVLSFDPYQSETYSSVLPRQVSRKVSDYEELYEWISYYVTSDEKYELSPEKQSVLKEWFHNVNTVSADTICRSICEFDEPQEGNYSIFEPSVVDDLKRKAKSSGLAEMLLEATKDYPVITSYSNLWKRNEYGDQKFPGLAEYEIRNRFYDLREFLDIESITIQSVPKTKNSYYIRPDE